MFGKGEEKRCKTEKLPTNFFFMKATRFLDALFAPKSHAVFA